MQARLMLMVRYVLMVTWECLFVVAWLHLPTLLLGMIVPLLVVVLLFGGTDFAVWGSDLVFGRQPSPSKALARLVLLSLVVTFAVICVGKFVPSTVVDVTDAYYAGLILALLHWVMVAFNFGPSFGELVARYKAARDEDYRREELDMDDTTAPQARPQGMQPTPAQPQRETEETPRRDNDDGHTGGIPW
jgi:hypothetical protein